MTSNAEQTFDELIEDSMMERRTLYCGDKHKRNKIETSANRHLRSDIPDKLHRHQLEDLCYMRGLETCKSRGGLLCEVAGAGKTLIALLHAAMNCSEHYPILIIASRMLLEYVWQPQIQTWLKDKRHILLNSAAEMREQIPKSGSAWGQHFILLNKDSMNKESVKDIWQKLKLLEPAYIFVDEGSFLGARGDDEKIVQGAEMVGAIKAENTFTWVITATALEDSLNTKCDMESKLMKDLKHFDAITQMRRPRQTLGVWLRNVRSLWSSEIEAVPHQQFEFVIRHSPASILSLLPELNPLSLEFKDEDDRKRRFLREIVGTEARPTPPELKVLVAGMSDLDSCKIRALLKQKKIGFVCQQTDRRDMVKKFVSDPMMRVALLSPNMKYGIDSLKVARKVIFWSEEHEDFTNLVLKKTIIARIRRLGCNHKNVDVVSFSKAADSDEEEMEVESECKTERPVKKARISDASSSQESSTAD